MTYPAFAQQSQIASFEPTIWKQRIWLEDVRQGQFHMWKGPETGDSAIIRVVDEGVYPEKKTIRLRYLEKLTGQGKAGMDTLIGNEEALLGGYNDFEFNSHAHATAYHKYRQSLTLISFSDQEVVALRRWMNEKIDQQTAAAFASCWVAPTAADNPCVYNPTNQGNAFIRANLDRIHIPGIAAGATATTLGAASVLDDIVGAFAGNAQDFSAAALVDMALKARLADPIIRPLSGSMSPLNDERFIAFMPVELSEIIKNDDDYIDNNQNAGPRSYMDNMLFTYMDGMHRGTYFRGLHAIQPLTINSVKVYPVYLCGAAALGEVWDETPIMVPDMQDYARVRGMSIQASYGMRLLERPDTKSSTTTYKMNGMVAGLFTI